MALIIGFRLISNCRWFVAVHVVVTNRFVHPWGRVVKKSEHRPVSSKSSKSSIVFDVVAEQLNGTRVPCRSGST